MSRSTQRIRDSSYFRIGASDVAAWLNGPGRDSWWSVDGDPILTDRLNFPCPSEDLANELRRIDRRLLLLDARQPPTAHGELISAEELDAAKFTDSYGDRAFQFCWEDGPDTDWVMFEDRELARISLGLSHDDGEDR